MAIIVNFAGASLLVPGAYSDVNPATSGLASPALGVIALIGEAEEGPAFSQESGLSAVTYGPDEFSAIQEKFGAGELVDAAKLAISPSNDPSIQGGAQEIIVIKTNASSSAEALLPLSYGKLKAKKAGSKGNSISAEITIQASKAIIKISDLLSGRTEISDQLGGNAVMSIQCTDADATTATVTIDATSLKTSVSGATVAAPLNVELKNFSNVSQLVAYINAMDGYSASASSAKAGSLSYKVLDQVSAVDIKSAASINKDAHEVAEFFAKSSLVKFEQTAKSGIPTAMAKKFLAGGSKGATSNAAIQMALDSLLKRRVNFVVPLFSQDASADIAENKTDAASSYSIDTILAATRAHVNQASSVKGRKERQAFCGYYNESYDAVAEKSADISSARVQLHFCKVDVYSSALGANAQALPHMSAVLSAGMKAAAPVGEPNTYKQPAIFGFSHPDFDSETQAEKAIKDNLCFPEKSPQGGYRFVLDNSTYSQDADAWIFNRPAVLYAADTAAYSIRINTETFVGRRNSDVSVESVKNLLVEVFDTLRSSGIIVGDTASKGKGYKDLSVKIVGSIVYISVTLILVEGLEFILNDIKVQRAA
jgi:hypothetical protein